MESRTYTYNPVETYCRENGYRVIRAEGYDWEDTKTEMVANKTNTLLSEKTGSLELYLVHDYEIGASEDLQLTITANNDTILSTTEHVHEFGEGVLIHPSRRILIEESHSNKTIPIRVKVHNTRYVLAKA